MGAEACVSIPERQLKAYLAFELLARSSQKICPILSVQGYMQLAACLGLHLESKKKNNNLLPHYIQRWQKARRSWGWETDLLSGTWAAACILLLVWWCSTLGLRAGDRECNFIPCIPLCVKDDRLECDLFKALPASSCILWLLSLEKSSREIGQCSSSTDWGRFVPNCHSYSEDFLRVWR